MPKTDGACYLCGTVPRDRPARVPLVDRWNIAKLACPDCARQEEMMKQEGRGGVCSVSALSRNHCG